ncbi:MAG: putative porin [Methylovulum sp.]|nr:putative porin [Methylovulum sp.]
MDNKKQLIALAFCGLVSVAQAGEKEELLKLRNTTTNLIKELVKQGVLTEKVADEMIKKAEADAAQQTEQQAAQQTDAPEPGEIRVPYVPEFVKDEIRQQVRSELRADVVHDVMQEAKTQKWGVPDALPEWISRFKMSGDLRLRSQNDFMADYNRPGSYFDYQAINQLGGITAAGINAFPNSTNDRHRFRERLRLAIDAKVADGVKAGVRLATSNIPDPVSTNQTLGNTGSQYDFNVDRAYLKYDAVNAEGFKWLTLTGGRMANPWYVGGGEFTGGSELVWDVDLSFEGFAATYRHSLHGLDALHTKDDDKHSVFATAGAFPLQESALSANDKWLFGSQVGLDWGFENQDAFKLALAYFDYENTKANPNQNTPATCDTNSPSNNLSLPQFMQFGNTVAAICYEGNAEDPGQFPAQYGLASDYNIINASAAYDIAKFAPHHIIVGVDYAKNIGFDSESVQQLVGSPISDATNAWQVRVDFGWPKVDHASQWNVFALYKYVERDAVFDAYTDSDFHLGGTNAKGWVVGGNYGLMKNVWATGRWLSTDVITGPKYGNDILQLDLNTRF